MQKVAAALCLFLAFTPRLVEQGCWKTELKRGYLTVPFWDANANHQSFVLRQDVTQWTLPIYYLLVPDEKVYERLFNMRGLLVDAEVFVVRGGDIPHYVVVSATEVKEPK